MAWSVLANKEKIREIIDSLISHKREVKARIDAEKTIFTSRLIETKQEHMPSEDGSRPTLIMERLIPENGNELIESSSVMVLEFLVGENLCRCPVEYLARSWANPDSGLITSFPESLVIKEKRREERFVYEEPESVSVQLRLGKGRKQERVYDLPVLNCSRHGLALLITQDDVELLHMLPKGKKVNRMTFYTGWAVIEVNGRVAHKIKIETGEHRGCYLIGIESDEVIEYCKPWKEF